MDPAASASSTSAAASGSTVANGSLGDLTSVREMLDFLAQNRLEAVRIDMSEDEDSDGDAQRNSESDSNSRVDDGKDVGGTDGSGDIEAAAAASHPGRRTARKKLVLRRRRTRTRAAVSAAENASPLSAAIAEAAAKKREPNALSDLANVTELLDFLTQNRLEAVHIELSDNSDASDDEDEGDQGNDGTFPGNPVRVSRLNDLANVREMLEFLAQNRLERVRIEIPETGEATQTQTQNDSATKTKNTQQQATASKKKKKKKRKRTEAVLMKDREFAKKVYYKTLMTLTDLQNEVTRLEAESEELIARHRGNGRSREEPAHNEPSTIVTDAQSESLDMTIHQSFRERYLQLLFEKDALLAENQVLEGKSAALEKLKKDLAQLAGAEIRANARTIAEWEERSERPRGDEMRPVTLEYCAQVTRRAYARVLEFRGRSSPSDFTWGPDLFGWKDFRSVEGSCLTYSLEKIFLFQSAHQIAAKFWEMTIAEDAAQHSYSPSLKVRFHTLQKVDADNIVIYRTIDRTSGVNGMEQRMKTFVLVSRKYLGDDRGWIIFFCALDPARVLVSLTSPPKGRTRLEPMREEMWIDNLKWTLCEPMGESAQHCKQSFGGVLDGIATANPSQWILEELMVGIRYERGGRGPFNILCD